MWGDEPVARFLRGTLEVEPDRYGCYSSTNARLRSHDGVRRPIPQKLYYCPKASFMWT